MKYPEDRVDIRRTPYSVLLIWCSVKDDIKHLYMSKLNN